MNKIERLLGTTSAVLSVYILAKQAFPGLGARVKATIDRALDQVDVGVDREFMREMHDYTRDGTS